MAKIVIPNWNPVSCESRLNVSFVVPPSSVISTEEFLDSPFTGGILVPVFSVGDLLDADGDAKRLLGVPDVNDLSYSPHGSRSVAIMHDPRLGFFERADIVGSAADSDGMSNGLYDPEKSIESNDGFDHSTESSGNDGSQGSSSAV